MDREAHYSEVWRTDAWGVPKSGAYALPAYTAAIRRELPRIIERYGIRSMFDAPCGDFTWMRDVKFPEGFRYIGADIVPECIEGLKQTYPGREFRCLDILAGPFPETDLWFCRDCLYLLSFADIARVFQNFLNSSARFLMLTCDFNHHNSDTQHGQMRALNFMAAPFGLPTPLEHVLDWGFAGCRPGLSPRAMYLWSRGSAEPSMRQFVRQSSLQKTS